MIVEYDGDCLDNSHAWYLHLNMYNSIDLICCMPPMKREFGATFLQLTSDQVVIRHIYAISNFLTRAIAFKTIRRLGYLLVVG